MNGSKDIEVRLLKMMGNFFRENSSKNEQ